MLSSTMALYSSGPVMPSMWKQPVGAVVPQRHPQPGGLHQDRQRGVALEVRVAGPRHVPQRRHRDVGVDVEGRTAGGPVPRALLATDRAPRERRPGELHRLGPLAGQIEGRPPPTQRVSRGMGSRRGQHRQHEALGVPEGVAVVAGSGQALGRDCPLLGAGAGLKGVEQREANRLLDHRVALDLDVGTVPEPVEGAALVFEQLRPSPREPPPTSAASTWSRRAGIERWLDHPYATNLVNSRLSPGSSTVPAVSRAQSGCATKEVLGASPSKT